MEKILVTGALGQIGTELVAALRERYGREQVVASDLNYATSSLEAEGPYVKLDVSNGAMLARVIGKIRPTQIYHLAAVLSAKGEEQPVGTWDLNMQSLLGVLEMARMLKCKVFWPSSIAVFGQASAFCGQDEIQQPRTVYGISKAAGEIWCQYYFERYGVDVRSIRFPGLISHSAQPGGGTTDYAVSIFHEAIKTGKYQCYLDENTLLPMLYMPDAIRATLELMAAERVTVRTSYNLWGMSFTPKELVDEIRKFVDLEVTYVPDFRQAIAESWPGSMNGNQAGVDWGWKLGYDLQAMVKDMLAHLEVAV